MKCAQNLRRRYAWFTRANICDFPFPKRVNKAATKAEAGVVSNQLNIDLLLPPEKLQDKDGFEEATAGNIHLPQLVLPLLPLSPPVRSAPVR